MVNHIPSVQNNKLLKAEREKYQETHKGRNIRITPDSSMEILKDRKACTDVLQTPIGRFSFDKYIVPFLISSDYFCFEVYFVKH